MKKNIYALGIPLVVSLIKQLKESDSGSLGYDSSGGKYQSMPQIGDMTLEQYMNYRNPQGKFHEQGSYTASWNGFNNPFRGGYEPELYFFETVGRFQTRRNYNSLPVWKFKQAENAYVVVEDMSNKWDKKDYVARVLIIDGIVYYDNFDAGQDLKSRRNIIIQKTNSDEYLDIDIKSIQETKYLHQKVMKMLDVPKFFREKYPCKIRTFERSGMSFEIRSESQPEMHKGQDISLFDENGYKVGAAQNEWGATLVLIAKEFRGHGLAKELLKEWLRINPNKESGGFTESGYHNSRSMWKDRVLELQQLGHYQSYEDQKRAKLILTEAKSLIKPKINRSPLKEPEEPVRIMAHMFGDTNVILYDAKLLEIEKPEQTLDEDLIYGYILFRENEYGMFIYQIDYDNRFRKFVTLAGFQFAKDMGYQIYYPQEQTRMYQSFVDVVESQGIEQLERQGEHLLIKQDIIPLRDMFKLDRMMIRKAFPKRWQRDTFLTNLQEQAYGKWHPRKNSSKAF